MLKECGIVIQLYMKTLTTDHKGHHCDNKYESMIVIDIIVCYKFDF